MTLRICSLLPSATEIVYALGLGDCLVGVSHTCDFPPQAQKLPVLTQSLRGQRPPSSTLAVHGVSAAGIAPAPSYALNDELLRELKPDLILTQDICDVCAIGSNTVFEVATKVLGYTPQFVTIQVAGLEDILKSFLAIGQAAGIEGEAAKCVATLRERIKAVCSAVTNAGRPRRVLCVEWAQPLMAAGLWTPELVQTAGGTHGLTEPGERSRRVSWDEVAAFAPEVVLFMPCGYAMARCHRELARIAQHLQWAALPAVRAGEVYVFDGRVPSRHGPRTVDVLESFAEVLHPTRFTPQWDGILYQVAGSRYQRTPGATGGNDGRG